VRGNLWECTAMPEIRVAAHALATRLSARCAPQPDMAAAP